MRASSQPSTPPWWSLRNLPRDATPGPGAPGGVVDTAVSRACSPSETANGAMRVMPDNPLYYPITIRLEPVEGEPIHGEEMFVARCADFPELMVAEESPHRAYDGMMAMIERMWWNSDDVPGVALDEMMPRELAKGRRDLT